jgi:hypothetical protein
VQTEKIIMKKKRKGLQVMLLKFLLVKIKEKGMKCLHCIQNRNWFFCWFTNPILSAHPAIPSTTIRVN